MKAQFHSAALLLLHCSAAALLLLLLLLHTADIAVADIGVEKQYFEVESFSATHKEWQYVSAAEDYQLVKFTVALKQRNAARLEELFWQVSTPGTRSYAQYYTVQELGELISPEEATVQQVQQWMVEHGARNVATTLNRDFVTGEMTVAQAETMLDCGFGVYKHVERSHKLVRCTRPYSVPAAVAPLIDFVGGTTRFPSYKFTPKVVDKEVGVHLEITPRILRARYGVTSLKGQSEKNSQAVAQFLDQHFDELDLQEFFTLLFPEMIGHTVKKVVGPNHIPAGVEASLDIEYIMSVGAEVPTWFWSTGGLHDNQEPFLEWIVAVSNTTDAPLVHSVSYGDVESSLSVDYMERLNTEFQKVGMRGISILFSSGDDGAGCNEAGDKFEPNFPVSSPYVTGVGGTTFASLLSESEEVTAGLSGGGFSNIFARPSYQDDAVQAYLADGSSHHLPNSTYYNHTGRGYPDIAAAAEGFTVVVDLVPMPGVAGTSCSSPTTAGVISLINDALLVKGKPSLGFLNPLLYKAGAAKTGFHDVVKDCSMGCDMGFCAAPGWDPATGNGTPNYSELLAFAESQLDHAASLRW